MKVRCRLSCGNVHEVRDHKGVKVSEEITMGMDFPDPANAGSESEKEITKFYNASPGVSFNLTVDNQEAFGAFKSGHSYYLDIIEVPPELQPQWLQDSLAKASG